MILLREAVGSDAAVMARLHAATFEIPWDFDVFRLFLSGHGAFGLLADGPEPAGFILCRLMAGEAEILTLAVDPARRREGMGAKLLGAAIDHARDAGADALFLEVSRDNDAALGLYRQAKFGAVGVRRAYYSGPNGATDALVMRRDLNR